MSLMCFREPEGGPLSLSDSDLARLKSLASGTYTPPPRDEFDIAAHRLFGGISGVPLPVETFDLGFGLTLRRTYAKVTAPFVMSFAPPPTPTAPSPGPWAALAEKSLLILTEIELAGDAPSLGFDRLNTLWFVVALLRLKLALPAKMPVLSDRSMQDIPAATERANIVPIELQLQQLLTAPPANPALSDFEWVRDNLQAASDLMKLPTFNRAFQTFDSAVHAQTSGAGIVTAWASLETLIRPGSGRITDRLCRALAAYLEPPGPGRDRAFTSISNCYQARGGAAHAGAIPEAEEFHTAFRLARAAIVASIEAQAMPNIDALLLAWTAKS